MFDFSVPPPLSLYAHVPWCLRKCPYCDFNSHQAKAAIPERAYIDALISDLEQELPEAWGRPVISLFIGGGTPSLFAPESFDRLLSELHARVKLLPEAEITLEANPGAVEQGRFKEFRAAGINRLSIGVQSFDDGLLKRLGRIHGRTEALRAAEAARGAGFDNLNLDLMFGLPTQSLAQAEADVAQAITLAPTHISYYQLTVEPNTAFAYTPPALPDDDLRYEMQIRGAARFAEAGFAQYEISGYAREGFRCRHNLNYWQFGDYLGIGAGAHGKLTLPGAPLNEASSAAETHRAGGSIRRRWKVHHPQDYLEKAAGAERIGGESTLASGDAAFEFMMNALRLNEGFPASLFSERTGLPSRVVEQPLCEAERRGFLIRENGQVRPTPLGALFLNELLELFLP